MTRTYACDGCGKMFPLHLLDAKPGPGPITEDNENRDFTWLGCKTCYGPGWVEGVRE